MHAWQDAAWTGLRSRVPVLAPDACDERRYEHDHAPDADIVKARQDDAWTVALSFLARARQ